MISMKKYLKESERTASKAFHFTEKDAKETLKYLLNVSMLGGGCDQMKRIAFYGMSKDDPRIAEQGTQLSIRNQERQELIDSAQLNMDQKFIDRLHAILGKQSELGELIDGFISSIISDEEYDEVNAGEEMGDDMWYNAMFLRTLKGMSFESVADANIKKLMLRFPDKFTDEKAANRDLKKERKSLEENLK